MTSAVDPPFLKEKRQRSLGVVIVLSVLVFMAVDALSVVASTAIVFLRPRTYQSSARVKVEEERPPVGSDFSSDPYFQQTQCEIIRSQKILTPVVESLGLRDRWAKEGQEVALADALRILRSRLGVHPYRDTSLIEIVVQDAVPTEAAAIANGIAESYVRFKMETKRQQVSKGISKLREVLKNQQQRVEAARQKVDQLRGDVGQTNGAAFLLYRNAQIELEAEQRMYEALKARVVQASTEVGTPRSPAEVIDDAVPSRVPLAPGVLAGALRGALIGLPLGITLSLLTALSLYRKP